MPGISRVNQDSAGGIITGSGASSVYVNDKNVSLINDSVTPHAPPDTPHMGSPKIISASSTVFANGKPVVRQGDSASCGHTTSGSSNVFAN